MDKPVSYRKITYLALMVQFVNFLEYVMINPLSPDYIVELGIISSHVGLVLGAYAFSAFFFGLIASSFVDKYDRKKVLLVCLSGMLVGTTLCILSFNFASLIFSRIIAGAFGGPATAITIAILSDYVPEGKRGKAFGKMMSAFPLASIVGIPLALEISRISKWQFAYVMVFILEVFIIITIRKILPNITSHITIDSLNITKFKKMYELLNNKNYLIAISSFFLTFFSFFLIIPIIPTYFIFNLNFPRENLGMLFFIGGMLSFFTVRLVGRLSDKFDSFFIISFITAILIPSVILGYGQETIHIPPFAIFLSFMLCISSRNAALVIATSKLPSPKDRAGYLALQNAIQNLASGLGGFTSAFMLTEGSNLELVGLHKVVFLTVATSLIIPFLVKSFEKKNR